MIQQKNAVSGIVKVVYSRLPEILSGGRQFDYPRLKRAVRLDDRFVRLTIWNLPLQQGNDRRMTIT